jgi:hypothetical protein
MSIPKGTVVLCAFYSGTGIDFPLAKENYTSFCACVKQNGKKQVKNLLTEMSEEKVANYLQLQLDHLLSKLLTVSNTSEESLKLAWGEKWSDYKMLWIVNVSALLHLKRIKNDENNGWLLCDHNSYQFTNDNGPVVIVADKDMERAARKFNKIQGK